MSLLSLIIAAPLFAATPTYTDSGVIGVNLVKVGGTSISSSPASVGLSMQPLLVAPPLISSVTSCGTSVQAVGSRAGRKRLVCGHIQSNTDFVTWRWNVAAVATDTQWPLGYIFDTGITVSSTSLNFISNSGCQTIRCNDY